jgi:hypothetical protein
MSEWLDMIDDGVLNQDGSVNIDRKTEEAIDAIDRAEAEIKKILKKYDMTIGMLYDEGTALTLTAPLGKGTITMECFN